MKKITGLTLAGAFTASLFISGCSTEDPCLKVPELDPRQRAAAVDLLEMDDRFEIEYAVSDEVDCELDDDGTFGREEEH